MHSLPPIVNLAIFVAAIMYILGPITIWLTFRQRAYSPCEIVDPSQLPKKVWDYFASLAADLAHEGFSVAAYLKQTGSVAGVTGYVAVWLNEHRGQLANVIVVSPTIGATQRAFEFETIAGTSGEVVTTISIRGDAGVYESRPWKHSSRSSWITKPRDLYQIHLYRERK